MAALASLLLLAHQAPPPGDVQPANRRAVEAALVRAHVAVDRIGHCTEERPADSGLENTHRAVAVRLYEAAEDAEGFYPDLDPVEQSTLRQTEMPPPTCTRASVQADEAEAGRALDATEALLRSDAAARAPGLWLGPLRLCGDRVEGIGEDEPAFEGGPRQVIVRFAPAFAPRVHALTAAFLRRRLPVILNGRVIVRPTVNEPVSWAISIAADDMPPVEQFRRAVAASC